MDKIASLIKFGVVISGNFNEVASDEKHDSLCKPFLEGDEIGSYTLNYGERFLYYNKELLHRSRTPDLFENPKIMVQRITGGSNPIKATFERSYDPNHPVRNHIETLDSMDVVRTIREALKR